MNAGTPPEWNDVAGLWQSETVSISIDELNRHARRNRLRLTLLVIAELLAAAIGIATAAWLMLASPMRYLGWGFGTAIAVFTAVVLRWQWSTFQETGEQALKALESAANREDQVREFLRIGRAVLLAALLAVVMAASALLREFHGGSPFALAPLIASAVYLIAVTVCFTWIDRSAHRRAAVYRRLREHLSGVNHSES